MLPFSPEVDLHQAAALTLGFVGAHLSNPVNEAAQLASRKHEEGATPDLLPPQIVHVLHHFVYFVRLFRPPYQYKTFAGNPYASVHWAIRRHLAHHLRYDI